MFHFQFVVSVVLLISGHGCFVLQGKADDCPQNCSCTYSTFDCRNQGLLHVPFIPSNSGYGHCNIYLSNNEITTILPGTFKNLSTCDSFDLVLNNNNIHTLSEGVFDEIINSSLSVQLSYNNFSYIPTVFRSLNNLRELVLNGNPLFKQLDTALMIHIGHTLTHFEFDMEYFQFWPYQLQYLRVLRTLTIGYIPFKRIPGDAFHGLEHTLSSLEIHDSQLVKIPQAVCFLEKLYMFNFSSNHNLDKRNSAVTEPCATNRLKPHTLFLDNNDLETFPSLFAMFQHIYGLDLKNNKLNIMIADLFEFSNFTVENINLERNNFSRIPYSINYLTALETLRIGHNYITSVDEPDVSKLVNLNFLDLSGNPLMYISHRSFQNNLKLQRIDLRDTKLRQIPSAVLYLTNLNSLFLDQDPIDCTCDLSYLKTWNNTGVISDSSFCYLSNERVKDYLAMFARFC